MRLRLIILCFLAGSLSGCVSRNDDPLPRQSVAARHATLADFPGTYRLIGGSALHRGADVNGSPGSLTPANPQNGDILRLTVSDRTITARYLSKGREIGSAQADISAARLNGGRLICPRATSRGVPILPGVIFSSGNTTTLYFAENRDLIVASQSWEAAAPLLIFPFYESERRVYRFHRISDHP